MMVVCSVAVVAASNTYAHCDTLQGPVVIAAREALAKRTIDPVLKWVQPADEPVIRAAFDRTLRVRTQSDSAAELADLWFFETLVRIHRAGEGAPYTGLKAAAAEEPGIAAADQALQTGKLDQLTALTIESLRETLVTKFRRTRELQSHAAHSVDAGRAFVAAYVDYVHFAEKLAAMSGSAAPSEHPAHAH